MQPYRRFTCRVPPPSQGPAERTGRSHKPLGAPWENDRGYGMARLDDTASSLPKRPTSSKQRTPAVRGAWPCVIGGVIPKLHHARSDAQSRGPGCLAQGPGAALGMAQDGHVRW